jgi:phosphoenolpyruvate synthase/pyruvate phosphate dikinase
MIDILTLKEIEMNVEAMAATREEKFQSALNAPILRAQLVMDVLSNPEVAAELKRTDPAEYERVLVNIKRMKAIAKARA